MNNRYLYNILLIFAFLCCLPITTQGQSLSIKNTLNGKEKIIKENRRIRIKTVNKDKFKGRFKIIDNSRICIKNDTIAIQDISYIRKDPFALKIVITGGLIYLGSSLIIVGLVFDAFGAATAISGSTLSITGVGVLGLGFLSPVLIPSKKTKNNWHIEIVPSQ